MKRLFGTDGIRGVANSELTPELALTVGKACAHLLQVDNEAKPLLIGRDPRLSGHMLEGALLAGITSVGVDVILVDVVPTPAVAYLTRTLDCCGGIMVSASHNPLEDNGIKVFGPDGFKLSDKQEREIEDLVAKGIGLFPKPVAGGVGKVIRKPGAGSLYLEELRRQVPLNLKGLHLALDCANGATSGYATKLFRSLGAQVTTMSDQPNGVNINHYCGSTYPEKIQNLAKEVGADLGFAFDGDGDRLIAVDEEGNLIDGDHILAIIGLHLLNNGQLPNDKIVATAYSNGGLRQAFLAQGGDVQYAPVGDRFVLEKMQSEGCILGGEQSGHILFLENSTTGDGMLTALKLLETRAKQDRPLTILAKSMEVFPQRLVNVSVKDKTNWDKNPRIKNSISKAQDKLGPLGRIFIRASGTESLIRILGEHPNAELLDQVVQEIAVTIKEAQEHSDVS